MPLAVDPTRMARAADWLRSAARVTVFSGAGVSAESGIATFRDDDGFWRRFPPETFATWRGLLGTAFRNPRRLADFLREVLGPIAAARPNDGHAAIAELETYKPVTVVTQNIDALHQAAGSTRVLEIHGSLFETISLIGRIRRRISRERMSRMVAALGRAETGPCKLIRVLRVVGKHQQWRIERREQLGGGQRRAGTD